MVKIAGVAMVALGIVLAGLFLSNRHQEHAARHDAAVRRLSILVGTQKGLEQDETALESAGNRFDTAYQKALVASDKRHDSKGEQTSAELKYATTEYDEVAALQEVLPKISASYESFADHYATLYGDDSIRQLRADSSAYLLNQGLALNHWGRAIGDIKDSLTRDVNGEPTLLDQGVEKNYQDSDDFETRSKANGAALSHDLKSLYSRFTNDLSRAKRDDSASR